MRQLVSLTINRNSARKSPYYLITVWTLIISVFLFYGLSSQVRLEIWGLLLLTFALLSLPPIVAALQNRFDIFEPLYLWMALWLYLFCFRPLFSVLEGTIVLETYFSKALVISIIGLIYFYIGYFSRVGRQLAFRLPLIEGPYSSRVLRIDALAVAGLALTLLVAFIQASGGFTAYFSVPHKQGGRYMDASTIFSTAYVWQAHEMLIPASFLLYQNALERRKAGSFPLFMFFSLLAFYLFSGERDYTFDMIVSMFVFHYLRRGKRPSLIQISIIAGMLFVILGLLPVYRMYFHLGADLFQIAAINPKEALIGQALETHPSGDEFTAYTTTVALFPDYINYGYGRAYLQLFIHWIPRPLWPSKPGFENRPDYINNPINPIGAGYSDTILGDFYSQFGVIAVILGMFISGVLWKTLYCYYKRSPTSPFTQLLYTITLPTVLIYIAQSPHAWISQYPFFIFPVISAFLIARRKRQ